MLISVARGSKIIHKIILGNRFQNRFLISVESNDFSFILHETTRVRITKSYSPRNRK